ncbi:dynamin family protein [Geodermatophilus sp. SYSU D00703]
MTGPTTPCPACGTPEEPGAQFCLSCGEYLGWVTEGSRVPATEGSRVPATEGSRVSASPTPAPVPVPVPVPPEGTSGAPAEGSARAAAPPPGPAEASQGPTGGSRPDPLADTLAVVDSARRLALERNRPDLADRLAATRERLAGRILPVVVVGEFKHGKSTLVNALLRRAVCPVDADLVTAVPTLVRHGESASATAIFDPPASGEEVGPPRTEPLPLAHLPAVVSEFGRGRGAERPTSVEVRLPHPLLRSGLALVDTPGVGGLDSAHGVLTLNSLAGAAGALFVTDASTELTAPEVDFLRLVLERCPDTACVVTKIDLYPQWRQIVELDRAHLAREGLDLPVLGVSSFLRLQPEQDADLTEESGFRPLVRFLAGRVAAGIQQSARAAAADVRFATAQLGRQVEAERQVVTRPQDSERVLQRLDSTRARTERLASPAAGWQQALADRVQDLVNDVDHELQRRLRDLARDLEELIDRGDPKDSWPDVEAWMRREAAAAVVATYDTMHSRAAAVVEGMATFFDLEAGTPSDVTLSAPTGHAEDVDAELGPLGSAGLVATTLAAVRSGALVPVTLFAVVSNLPLGMVSLAATAVLGPITLVLVPLIIRKGIRDERARQLAHRRQLAKAAARRYLDEVTFRASKDCRDALRHLQRRLRDEFQDRASAMHRSSLATLAAAQAAHALGPAERTDRAEHLARQTAELRRLQQQLPAADAAPAVVVRRG